MPAGRANDHKVSFNFVGVTSERDLLPKSLRLLYIISCVPTYQQLRDQVFILVCGESREYLELAASSCYSDIDFHTLRKWVHCGHAHQNVQI